MFLQVDTIGERWIRIYEFKNFIFHKLYTVLCTYHPKEQITSSKIDIFVLL